ncbi:leucine-rich repeat extensin-like protein 2 isoform X2 [Sander lucioperca]|uniref:leucine-rich repeat extensin-like protein 2 isoform X2 n=2 Tax=Sander lucioperca TaxID=283035 RepID=UPI001653C183|nr:leucine-rich repeat extensin-like protein 2 isoform X2 [Sander lucioperca]
MMAVWCMSGALLLVLLTGLSYSYPMKQASAGSNWMLPSGGFAPSGSWAASKTVSNPAQSSFQNAPAPPGYAQGSSAGPAPPASKQGISWAVAPPPQPLGLNIVSRPDSSLPQYQAGELIQEQKSFEHGNSESETEEQGSIPPPPFVYAAPPPQGFNGGLVPSGLVPYPYPNPYPYYDYMFLTGQYPPGTYTYTSNSFEQGRDSWENARYTRDNYPSTQQAKNIPYKHRTVRQASIGSASHGQSGAATGQQQLYSGVDVQGSYSQLGRQRGEPRSFM